MSTITVYLALSLIYNYTFYCTTMVNSGDDTTYYTGWLLSPDRQAYLMFVPVDALLPDSFNILTIPNSAASSVDFKNAAIGSQWNICYTP